MTVLAVPPSSFVIDGEREQFREEVGLYQVAVCCCQYLKQYFYCRLIPEPGYHTHKKRRGGHNTFRGYSSRDGIEPYICRFKLFWTKFSAHLSQPSILWQNHEMEEKDRKKEGGMHTWRSPFCSNCRITARRVVNFCIIVELKRTIFV